MTSIPPPPPPAQPPMPYGGSPAKGTNGLAIASLVLGILGVVACGFTFFIGPLLAVIFGALAKKQIRERGQSGAGMATGGLVLGIIGLVSNAIFIFFVGLSALLPQS